MWLDHLTDVAITLLFFLHGAKLSRQAVIAGITHWRLHLTILAATFLLFPALTLGLSGARLARSFGRDLLRTLLNR